MTAAANPPRHVQTDEEEAFYVLDGEIEFEVDGLVAIATPGTFAFVPRGAARAPGSRSGRTANCGGTGPGRQHICTAVHSGCCNLNPTVNII